MGIVFNPYINKQLKIEVSGKKTLSGILIDNGSDIIVIYNGTDYLYIPMIHIHSWKTTEDNEDAISNPNEPPILQQIEEISLRKTLTNAKGIFIEMFVTGNKTIHGYLTSIMNDYLVFHSPVLKTIYVSIKHVKWLIPYKQNINPYALSSSNFPINPSSIALARTFEIQIAKFIGQLVIINMGDQERNVGKIKQIEDGFVELVTARNDNVFINLNHLKSIHLP